MAIKSKTICDRCGAEIPNRLAYPVTRLFRRMSKLKRIILFSNDPYDYVEQKIDLCRKCQVSFAKWLKGEND